MSLCKACNKDVSMDIELGGNPELQPTDFDHDGWVCSQVCFEQHQKNVNTNIEKINNMSYTEFKTYLGG